VRKVDIKIWQDLVDTRGFAGGYQSVKRFVRKLVGGPSKEACAVIETAVGEEAQVNYGTGPMVRDPHSGKYRRMRLFVLTLGYSRKSVRLLVFQLGASRSMPAVLSSADFASKASMRAPGFTFGKASICLPKSTCIPIAFRLRAYCSSSTAVAIFSDIRMR
jgi:hypothetical protein